MSDLWEPKYLVTYQLVKDRVYLQAPTTMTVGSVSRFYNNWQEYIHNSYQFDDIVILMVHKLED